MLKISCVVVSVLSNILRSMIIEYAAYCFQYGSVSVSFILSAASCANSQEWTLNRSIPEIRLVRWLHNQSYTAATSCGSFGLSDIFLVHKVIMNLFRVF